MNGYMAVLRKYAQFAGRSRRAEYWNFVLVNLLISIVASILFYAVGINRDDSTLNVIGIVLAVVMGLYSLFILIPTLALQWRRYQDIGWAGGLSIIGWFFSLLTLIVAFIPGQKGENMYGPDPKA